MSKKTIFTTIISLILVIFILIFNPSPSKNYYLEEEYFRTIYYLLRDLDFEYARPINSELILYNNNFEELNRISFNDNVNIKFLSIHRDGDNDHIYFIMGGSVDDDYGILFTRDSNVNMEGLHLIKRIGGNSYYYQTFI